MENTYAKCNKSDCPVVYTWSVPSFLLFSQDRMNIAFPFNFLLQLRFQPLSKVQWYDCELLYLLFLQKPLGLLTLFSSVGWFLVWQDMRCFSAVPTWSREILASMWRAGKLLSIYTTGTATRNPCPCTHSRSVQFLMSITRNPAQQAPYILL